MVRRGGKGKKCRKRRGKGRRGKEKQKKRGNFEIYGGARGRQWQPRMEREEESGEKRVKNI